MENDIPVPEAAESIPAEESNAERGTDCDGDELIRLRAEVKELNEKLLRKENEAKKIAEELGGFGEAFPEAEIKSLPDEVWESVKSGNSLAASYALYLHKTERRKARISEQNDRNAYFSAGHLGKSAESEYFSPDEVKRMSQSEVRANYSKIMESMKKWN